MWVYLSQWNVSRRDGYYVQWTHKNFPPLALQARFHPGREDRDVPKQSGSHGLKIVSESFLATQPGTPNWIATWTKYGQLLCWVSEIWDLSVTATRAILTNARIVIVPLPHGVAGGLNEIMFTSPYSTVWRTVSAHHQMFTPFLTRSSWQTWTKKEMEALN